MLVTVKAFAVIVPPAKLPKKSRLTSVSAAFVDVAFVVSLTLAATCVEVLPPTVLTVVALCVPVTSPVNEPLKFLAVVALVAFRD